MEARGAKGDRRWGDRANRKGRCQESEKETKAARLELDSWEEDGEATHQRSRRRTGLEG